MNEAQQTLNEKDFELFQKWLKVLLKKGVVTVTFTKKDGTEREMECTADPTIIMFKDPTILESKGDRKVNDSIMPVYDLKANSWKSFRWNSIKNVKVKI